LNQVKINDGGVREQSVEGKYSNLTRKVSQETEENYIRWTVYILHCT